jgi:hypothetical protein
LLCVAVKQKLNGILIKATVCQATLSYRPGNQSSSE